MFFPKVFSYRSTYDEVSSGGHVEIRDAAGRETVLLALPDPEPRCARDRQRAEAGNSWEAADKACAELRPREPREF